MKPCPEPITERTTWRADRRGICAGWVPSRGPRGKKRSIRIIMAGCSWMSLAACANTLRGDDAAMAWGATWDEMRILIPELREPLFGESELGTTCLDDGVVVGGGEVDLESPETATWSLDFQSCERFGVIIDGRIDVALANEPLPEVSTEFAREGNEDLWWRGGLRYEGRVVGRCRVDVRTDFGSPFTRLFVGTVCGEAADVLTERSGVGPEPSDQPPF